MLTSIAKNQYYDIACNPDKNRMYLRIKGYWKKEEDVSNYVEHIRQGGEQLKPGFNLMVDLREMKTPPIAMNVIHEKAQLTLMNLGLDRTAEIIPKSDIVLKNVTESISERSKMKKRQFTDPKEAELWLAEQKTIF